MPLNGHVRDWIKNMRLSGVPNIKPGNDFLLGFEAEKEEALPLKTYIRRLWLAFQSSKRPLPRYFFDPKAEDFSKEIDAWVSDYVNNPDLLAAERAKCQVLLPSLDNNPERIHNAFLEETARTILITREWGEQIWGHRKQRVVPLANEKREPGHDKPPEWPLDQDFIIMAVRQWMATRIQDRLQKPKDIADVPRVDCPEDPDQRRDSLRADLPNLVRYDSNELKDMGEEAKAPTAEEAPQDQKKVELGGPAPQPVFDVQLMIHNRHRYATSPTRRSSNAAPATPSRSQAGPSHASSLRSAPSHSIFDDGETSELSPRISLKRKRRQSQRFSSRKLRNMTPHATQTATSFPTPASSTRDAQNVAEQNLVASTPPIHSPGLHLVGGEDGGNIGGTLPRPTTTPPPIDLESTDDVGHLLSLFRKKSSRAAQPSAHPHQEQDAPPHRERAASAHQERDVSPRQEREVPSHREAKLRNRVCKCDRSLDGVIVMTKDCKTGMKQWTLNCCHGRPLVHGPRQLPCLCHNCQLLSLEHIAGAGTPETTPPFQPLHSTGNLRPTQASEQNSRRVTVQSLLTDL